MSTERVVIKNPDGTVSILIPAPKALKTMTITEIAEKDVPPDREWRICNVSDIPQDRIFRSAWTDKNPGDKVDVDIPRAREIAHIKRRKQRDKRMKPLDVEATIPFLAEAAETARKAIRAQSASMQVAIDEALTAEELKSIVGH